MIHHIQLSSLNDNAFLPYSVSLSGPDHRNHLKMTTDIRIAQLVGTLGCGITAGKQPPARSIQTLPDANNTIQYKQVACCVSQ